MPSPKKQFDVLTIYPNIFCSYFGQAIIKTAIDKKIIKINVHDLREYSFDNYKTVDDKPYGGGAGMVMKVDVIFNAVQKIIKPKKIKTRVLVFSAKGKTLKQSDLLRYKKYDKLVMICGRFEGIDQRVIDHIADEEISIGDYVLAGGEIPAMVVIEGVTRLLPKVLGNKDSLKEESFSKKDFIEYPQYTRPAKFQPSKKGKT
jgi:tRNA (guanine-N1)-methyltransferase